jgi:hypothetical protein
VADDLDSLALRTSRVSFDVLDARHGGAYPNTLSAHASLAVAGPVLEHGRLLRARGKYLAAGSR